MLALLAIVVRSTDVLATAAWQSGATATRPLGHDGVTLVTSLGATWTVVLVAAAVALVDFGRTRSRWVAPFLLAVILGDKLLTETVKEL